METPSVAEHGRHYRNSPWWVTAGGAGALFLLTAPMLLGGSFLGVPFAIAFLSFLVSAIVCAFVAVRVLGGTVTSMTRSSRPGLRLFGWLLVTWLVAWLLGIFAYGVANAVLGMIVAADQSVTIQSSSPQLELLPGFWVWSAPALAVFLMLSAPVARKFGRIQAGRQLD